MSGWYAARPITLPQLFQSLKIDVDARDHAPPREFKCSKPKEGTYGGVGVVEKRFRRGSGGVWEVGFR